MDALCSADEGQSSEGVKKQRDVANPAQISEEREKTEEGKKEDSGDDVGQDGGAAVGKEDPKTSTEAGPDREGHLLHVPQLGEPQYDVRSAVGSVVPLTVDPYTALWYYVDDDGREQGPFDFAMMLEWWRSGFFLPFILVRSANEAGFMPVSMRLEFLYPSGVPVPQAEVQGPGPVASEGPVVVESSTSPTSPTSPTSSTSPTSPTSDSHDAPVVLEKQDDIEDKYFFEGQYAQTAYFNKRTGRFQCLTPDEHWKNKGLPTDPSLRQMAHYFDYDSYQELMRQKTATEPIKKKPKKVNVQHYRELKEIKKRKKLAIRLGPD